MKKLILEEDIKPGMEILVKSVNGEEKRLIVGHINIFGGECGCCGCFMDSDEIYLLRELNL